MPLDLTPLENAVARLREGLARTAFRRIVERDRVVLQRVEDAGTDQHLNGASPRASSPQPAR